MTSRLRLIAAACLALLAIAAPQASYADEFSTNQRGEVERIVREYLIAHPEVIQDAMAELEKRQSAADAEKHKAAVKQYSEALFASPRQVVLGNPDGNVTFVEFFDYNCGYCKRAMDDMLTLMKNDPKLKIVLKEFPVPGPGSVEAAQVAIAVHMQDKSGKYLEFAPEAARRPGPGGQGPCARGCQGHRPRHGAPGQGPGKRGGQATLQESFKIRRGPRPQWHAAELCNRRQRRGRRGRPRCAEGKVNTTRCGKRAADGGPSVVFRPIVGRRDDFCGGLFAPNDSGTKFRRQLSRACIR
jgi:hypothetical protein